MDYGSECLVIIGPFAICIMLLVSMNHEVMARLVYSCFRPYKAYVSFSMVTIFDLASRSDQRREVELLCTRVVLSGADSCRRAASRLRVVLVSRECHSTRHEYTTTTIVVTYTSTSHKSCLIFSDSHCMQNNNLNFNLKNIPKAKGERESSGEQVVLLTLLALLALQALQAPHSSRSRCTGVAARSSCGQPAQQLRQPQLARARGSCCAAAVRSS